MRFTSWQGSGAAARQGVFVLSNGLRSTRIGMNAMRELLAPLPNRLNESAAEPVLSEMHQLARARNPQIRPRSVNTHHLHVVRIRTTGRQANQVGLLGYAASPR